MFVILRFIFKFEEWLWLMASVALFMATAVKCVTEVVSMEFIATFRFWNAIFCLVCSLLKCQISSVVTPRIWLKFNNISDTNAFCRSLILSLSDRLRLVMNFSSLSLESSPVMIWVAVNTFL